MRRLGREDAPTGDADLRPILRVLADSQPVLLWLRARRMAPGTRPRTVASDLCPACGSERVGTLESIPGVALARIAGGRLEWTGDTEIDWNGSETVRFGRDAVLACVSCGERWVHPSLVLNEI